MKILYSVSMALFMSVFLIIANSCLCQHADQYINLSNISYKNGNKDSSLYYGLRAEEIIRNESGIFNLKYAINAYRYIGKIFEDKNQIDSAERWFKISILTFQTIGEKADSNYGLVLNAMGLLQNNTGKYEEAEKNLLKAVEIFRSYSFFEYRFPAMALNNLANCYNYKGEYKKAEILYDNILSQILSCYDSLNYLSDAIEKHKSIYNRLKLYEGIEYNNLANIYSYMGLFEKGVDFSIKAKEIFQLPGIASMRDYLIAADNLGTNYTKSKQYDSAYTLYQQLFKLVPKKEMGNLYPYLLSKIAYLEAKRNYPETADQNLNEAIAFCKETKLESASFYWNILLLKGLTLILKKDYNKADSLYNYILNNNAGVNKSTNYVYQTAMFRKASVLVFTNNLTEAADSITSLNKQLFYFIRNNYAGMYENERLKLISTLSEKFDLMQSINQLSNIQPLSLQSFSNSLFLKSLSLNESKKSLQTIRNSPDTALRNMFQNYTGTKNYLAKQYTLPIAKQAPNLKEKEAEANDLEQQLALRSAEYRRYEQSINITSQDVFNGLKQGEAAIEFTSFRFHNKYGWTDSVLYAAIILTKNNSNPQWVFLFEEKQLKKLLFTAHPNLLYSNSKILPVSQTQFGDKLYSLVWKKIEPHLTGINTVYYSPAGILNQVAFAAMPLAGSNKTISSKYKLIQMGSTKNIVVKEPDMPVTDITLMGGISYNTDSTSIAANTADSTAGNANIYSTTILRGSDKGTKAFDYLPATLTEVDTITSTAAAAGITANIYTGNAATEEQLKNMNGHSPSVLHIATHGFYIPYKNKKAGDDINQTSFSLIEDPMLRSGIALAGANLKWNKNIDVPNREDGIVTAYEIAQMDFSKTQLVVLSACESGLGDIDGSEGVFGLQRGFKSAGVNKLIITLWQVPDKASMQFMTLFYTKWLKEKKEIRTAFSETQKIMSKKYKAEPYKWASFVLME